MLALERAGIPVEKYDAFEIDKDAIKVSENNHRFTVKAQRNLKSPLI